MNVFNKFSHQGKQITDSTQPSLLRYSETNFSQMRRSKKTVSTSSLRCYDCSPKRHSLPLIFFCIPFEKIKSQKEFKFDSVRFRREEILTSALYPFPASECFHSSFIEFTMNREAEDHDLSKATSIETSSECYAQ